MGVERFPKALLFELFAIDSDYELNIDRYNWVTLIKKTFFQPVGEMGFFESLQRFQQLKEKKTRLEIINKFTNYRRQVDREKYLESTSLINYPLCVFEKMVIHT